MVTPIVSEPIEESDYNIYMLWVVCYSENADGVIKINSIEDLEKYYDIEYNIDPTEFTALVSIRAAGVGVFYQKSIS